MFSKSTGVIIGSVAIFIGILYGNIFLLMSGAVLVAIESGAFSRE